MILTLIFTTIVLLFTTVGYKLGYGIGYDKGFSNCWWKDRGLPTMDEWDQGHG